MIKVGSRFAAEFEGKRHIDLIKVVSDLSINSIAVPALGRGLGGLDWAVVRPLIKHAFAEVPRVRVLLFEPT